MTTMICPEGHEYEAEVGFTVQRFGDRFAEPDNYYPDECPVCAGESA